MEWFVWIVKESDALYVINFEATCFLNQEEPEDYEHWDLKESRWLPNGKGAKNAGRGQFDAVRGWRFVTRAKKLIQLCLD